MEVLAAIGLILPEGFPELTPYQPNTHEMNKIMPHGLGGRGEVQVNGVNLTYEEAGKLGFLRAEATHPTDLDAYVKERKERHKEIFLRNLVKGNFDMYDQPNVAMADWWNDRTTETIAGVLERVRGMVEKDSDVRIAKADGNSEENFDFGYDTKKHELLSQLPNQK